MKPKARNKEGIRWRLGLGQAGMGKGEGQACWAPKPSPTSV